MRRHQQEITDLAVILAILDKAKVCRLALHDDPYPYIVPMNFGYVKDDQLCLYFHCAREGKKLDLIRKNNKVCFELEVDARLVSATKACGWTMHYKSVIGFGKLEIQEQEQDIHFGLNVIMKHYSGKDDYEFAPGPFSRSFILKLTADYYTAKKHSGE